MNISLQIGKITTRGYNRHGIKKEYGDGVKGLWVMMPSFQMEESVKVFRIPRGNQLVRSPDKEVEVPIRDQHELWFIL